MSKNVLRLVAMMTLVAFTGCASSTVIETKPTGAKLYLNGEFVGKTPYTMTDTKIIGTTTTVKVEMPGYETLNTSITRMEEPDIGPIIGGVCLSATFIGLGFFLWAMKYKPSRTYTLERAGGSSSDASTVTDSAEFAFAVARGLQTL